LTKKPTIALQCNNEPSVQFITRIRWFNTAKFTDAIVVKRPSSVVTQALERVSPSLQEKYDSTRLFLKMDTHGRDRTAANNAGPYFKNFVGLQSELAPTTLYKDQLDFNETLDFYTSADFKLSALIPNNKRHPPGLNRIDVKMYIPAFTIRRHCNASSV
jgi:hypothetical protein